MNKLALLIGGVVLLIVLIALIFVFKGSPTVQTNIENPVTFPSASSTNPGPTNSPQISVAEIQQGSIAVRNFKTDPTTVADPSNKGYYYLAGGAKPAITHPPYQIMYDENHQYFAIALYTEPLGQNRKQAEDFLTQELGLSQLDMCKLNYFVGVGKGVNDFYLAKNLGFSFCPGAIALPE